MVTVREQLPGRLNELSQEATVEHAEQAQHDLAEWLDRVRSILDDAKLEQLEEVANLTLQKELETTVNHRSNTFYTGIEMADILAHLHVDEDTLAAAMSSVKKISRWRVAGPGELEPTGRYRLDFRFNLDVSQLPRPFQIGLLGQTDWDINILRSQPLLPEFSK
jgi:hypothetical protein